MCVCVCVCVHVYNVHMCVGVSLGGDVSVCLDCCFLCRLSFFPKKDGLPKLEEIIK